MTIPKVIHRVRINAAKDCPPVFEETWQAWKLLHPDFEFHTWTEKGDDADARDVSEILGDSPLAELYWSLERWVLKADLLRVVCLLKYGGVYVDCDMMPLGHIGADLKGELTLGTEIPKKPHVISNAMFAAAPGNSFLHEIVLDIVGNLNHALEGKAEASINPISVTGPGVFSKAKHLLTPEDFCHTWQLGRPLSGETGPEEAQLALDAGMTVIHLLTSSWVSGSKYR